MKKIEAMVERLARFLSSPIFKKKPYKTIFDYYFSIYAFDFTNTQKVIDWFNEEIDPPTRR